MVFKFLKSINFTDLRWLIHGLNIASDTFREVRVLGEVTIQVCHALLKATGALPVSNKAAKLFEIHETNVINVSISLSCQHHSRWQTLVTHTKRIRLMLFASEVNLVAKLLTKCTVLAFLMGCMLLSTLLLLFKNILIKRVVLDFSLVTIDAVGALLICLMLANCFDFLKVFFGHTKTIETLLIG